MKTLMQKKMIAATIVAVLLLGGSLFAFPRKKKKKEDKQEKAAATQQAPGTTTYVVQPKGPLSLLVWGMVHGKVFVFRTLEPLGWRGDTEKEAIKYQVHIVFIPEDKDSLLNGTTVRVRVIYKKSEDLNQQWQIDKANYLKEYPDAQFGDVQITHPVWTTMAKSVVVPNKFYEDVAYLNSGADSPFVVACYLTKNNAPFTPAEFKAYEEVLHSLEWSKEKPPDEGDPVPTVEPGQQAPAKTPPPKKDEDVSAIPQ